MTRRFALVLAGCLALLLPAIAAAAPTPPFSSAPFNQDQPLTYRWKAGQVPRDWLVPAIHAGAADSNASRGSRAATFSYSSSGVGTVSYGEPSGCGSGGLACANRIMPFTIRFRAEGQQLDWGKVHWCQAVGWTDGCFDAELSALHEFGHVQILNHAFGGTSYADTAMNAIQRAKPSFGWNLHAYGRCDVATLQMTYDMQSWSAPYSTCLDLTSTSTLSSSATSVRVGTSATFTASVRTMPNAGYGLLSDNPLHGRTVVLQRASLGGSSWIDVAAMTPAAAAGVYTRSITINAAYQWRVSFRPVGEGVRPSTSGAATVRIQ